MKTNNTIYNKNRAKRKKPFTKIKKSYNCIFHCPININDCINSIDIYDDKVVFGTIMGDVYLCRVDKKKLNGKNIEIQKSSKKQENIKSSISLPEKTEKMENDASDIKLNNDKNNNNHCDCIQLSINNNNNNDDEIHENKYEDNDNNVKIFNKKNKDKNNIGIRINMNNNNNENHSKKNNNYEYDNKNYTDEDLDESDENSNKYEKTLINKNMGKIQSPQNNNNMQLNKSIIDSKLFNEKQINNKNNKNKEEKNKNIKINFPQITKLIIRSKENIPCLEFENHDIINISIGDLEVIRLENMSTFNINDNSSTYNYSKLRNYRTENDHIEFCETCTCMMKNSCYLIIFTQYNTLNSTLEIKDVKYENKNLKKFDIIQGTIKMSNYVVPFDFDGDQLLFLDYISKNERTINVIYTATKKEKYYYIIKGQNYGHICHMKLLPNSQIFLCKNNNECEIHLMNKDFELIEKWVHIGEDVISCYIYIYKKKIKIKNNELLFQSNNNNNNNNDNNDNDNDDNEHYDNNNINVEEKSEDEIKTNILKLFENKINNNKRKGIINNNQTIKINSFHPNSDKVNKITLKNKKKMLISSDENRNENDINYTENNQNNYNKKNLIINKIHSLNPSLDNSSRRDINITIENKKFTSNRNSKTNTATKYNLLTSDKKRKSNKNSLSSIEIFGKTKPKGKAQNYKIIQNNSSNIVDNEEDATIIKNKDLENISIFTLDKNGSVNIFNNRKQKTLFNIYNISNIDNKYKKIEFFSVGFPYYIIANELYIGITTDHGLFVISKKDN